MKPKITMAEYEEARDSNLGWCGNCEHLSGECVEPDAEEYECQRCGEMTVTGIEMALIEGLFEILT